MRSRAVTFTGIKFENPFLLSSAPPTESESNILRAFDAGWGGVVVKTIGLHPVVERRRRADEVLPHDAGRQQRVDEEAAGLGAARLVELGADLRQVARLVDAAHSPNEGGVSDARRDRVDHGGVRERQGAARLADARRGMSGRRRRRPRVQLLVSAHGPKGHGLEHRQGRRCSARW